MTFTAAATGTAPLDYHWQLNNINLVDGLDISGATKNTLKLTNVRLDQAGIYRLVVTNAAARVLSSNAVLTVIRGLPLADALDTPTWTWTTGGSLPWVGETNVMHDGVDGGRSGIIADGQSSSMFTTVAGPGTVSFWWKVSSEPSNDRLRLYVDGSTSLTISGEVDWQWQMVELGSGNHDLEWRYSKNGSTTLGQDRGWVDQVQFTEGSLGPIIISPPFSQTVGVGSTATFGVGAGGTQPLSYQWQFNGIDLVNGGDVSGTTTATLRLANVQPAQAGIYSVVVWNTSGTAISPEALLSVNTDANINTQPQDQTVGTGETATFSVGASGIGLNYQWRFNGTNLVDGAGITGATTASLVLTNAQMAQAGNYSVEVSNTESSVVSSNALLNVYEVLPLAEALDTTNWIWTTTGDALWQGQPIQTHDGIDAAWSGTVQDGQSSYLTTTVTGPGTLSWWWKVSSEPSNDRLRFYLDGSSTVTISGEVDWQQQILALTAGSHELEWRYYKNSSVTAGQDRGWVDQVQFLPLVPTIAQQPASATVDEELPATFTVVASGTPPLAYQWRHNGTNLMDGGTVTGATNATLLLSSAQLALAGTYSVIVSNAAGSVTSANAVLTVTPVMGLAEALETPDWVWTKSGFPPWVGQTNVMHDGVDAARSGAIANSQVTAFQTTVTGPGIIGFWWKVSSEPGNDIVRFSVNGSEKARISGEVDWEWRSFGLPAGAVVLEWAYAKNGSLAVGQDRGWVDEVVFVSAAIPTPPVIASPPTKQTIMEGLDITLTVGAIGTEPLGYQWRFNGVDLTSDGNVSGATSPSLTINHVLAAQEGDYSVVVSNSVGSVTSPSTHLTVITLAEAVDDLQLNLTQGGDASWIAQSALSHDGVDAARSGVIANGQNTRLETWVNGPGLLSFWWKVSSETNNDQLRFYLSSTELARISGETGWQQLTFDVPNGIQLLKWRYSKDASGVAGQDAGWVDEVQFIPTGGPSAPVIIRQPSGDRVGEGATVSFDVVVTGTAPFTYQWQFNGTNLEDGGAASGVTTPTLTLNNVQGTETGNYSVVINNALGSVTSASALLTVLTLPEAVDAPYLTLSMAGYTAWVAQTNVTHDGLDAAQSGVIPDGQNTRLETWVEGPGTVSFWWKVSSEANNDQLRFYVGADEQARISGEVDWQQLTFDVPAGTNLLKWRYSKDASGSAGQDAAWVDQVEYAPTGALTAPAITVQPASRNESAGATLVFSVEATGSLPLTYQWLFDGAGLLNGAGASGATTPTLTLANVQPGQAGTYSLVVSNGAGTVTSDGAVLTVGSASTGPVITRQPASARASTGETTTFNVVAAGTLPLSYQWQFNGTNLVESGDVRGTTTATLTLSNVVAAQEGDYSVVVSNAIGVVPSAAAFLDIITVADALNAPYLTFDLVGDASWFTQTSVTHDGVDAARSGPITDGQNTRLETWVEGPGTVSFWWKVSSETNVDQLRFYVGNFEQARLTGEVDWQWLTFPVPSGTQLLKWRYSKNASGATGQDAAWVDEVEFVSSTIPEEPTGTIRPNLVINNTTVVLTWDTLPGKTYRIYYKDNLSDPDWNLVAGQLTLTATTAAIEDPEGKQVQRFYQVVEY